MPVINLGADRSRRTRVKVTFEQYSSLLPALVPRLASVTGCNQGTYWIDGMRLRRENSGRDEPGRNRLRLHKVLAIECEASNLDLSDGGGNFGKCGRGNGEPQFDDEAAFGRVVCFYVTSMEMHGAFSDGKA